MDAPHIDEVTARNLRRLREGAGLGQEALARAARERLGLEWTRDHVAAIERGARRLSVGEVLALAHVFRVGLADFLAADGWVQLTPGLRAQGLPQICDPTAERFEDAEDATDRLIAPALEQARERSRPDTQAEQKAARALETSTVLVRAAALRQWKRPLDAERDRRVAEMQARNDADGGPELTQRAIQALRGHVARELYRELAAVLKTAPAPKPTEGSRKGSRRTKPIGTRHK